MKTLVIGGTGILTGTVKTLLDSGDEVYSVSRHTPTWTHPNLHPLLLDYRDLEALREALAPHAPFERAVVWIHGVAPEAPYLVAEFVTGPYFHVLGSAAADPSRLNTSRQQRFAALGTNYYEITLGFQLTDNGSRWLTNQEISAGVWQAVQQEQPRHIVGTVTPWSARP